MSAASESEAEDRINDTKYKGVRKRTWGKYVSEIRLPNSRERIWLGSYDSAKKAARAFDAALFCLRGSSASFNFPDNPPNIPGGRTLNAAQIQAAANRFANIPDSESEMQPEPEESSSSPAPAGDDGTGGSSWWNEFTATAGGNNVPTSGDPFHSVFPEFFDDFSDDYFVPPPPEDNNGESSPPQGGLFLWNF